MRQLLSCPSPKKTKAGEGGCTAWVCGERGVCNRCGGCWERKTEHQRSKECGSAARPELCSVSTKRPTRGCRRCMAAPTREMVRRAPSTLPRWVNNAKARATCTWKAVSSCPAALASPTIGGPPPPSTATSEHGLSASGASAAPCCANSQSGESIVAASTRSNTWHTGTTSAAPPPSPSKHGSVATGQQRTSSAVAAMSPTARNAPCSSPTAAMRLSTASCCSPMLISNACCVSRPAIWIFARQAIAPPPTRSVAPLAPTALASGAAASNI
mmetsp:Transcript_22975/g.71275  ORF Transcript_22975/g.71275 Transcript_22975/m.71275 type:complete len:271 (+) Transcript_22975:121-933(+)